MKNITEAFNSALGALTIVDWTETDGSDVQKILKAAFSGYERKRKEILKMFSETSALNKFQKLIIENEFIK